MICVKCKREIPEGSLFCPQCGKKQASTQRKGARRGNGTGSVYKRKDGGWMAVKVVGYEPLDNGKLKAIRVTKGGFPTKKAAVEYLPQLAPRQRTPEKVSFAQLFRLWLPTHERQGKSKSTMNCYKAAFKYFRPVWPVSFDEITIDDLQECIDDCPHGKRTRENMKALGTLLYAYAIPRGYAPGQGGPGPLPVRRRRFRGSPGGIHPGGNRDRPPEHRACPVCRLHLLPDLPGIPPP